MYNFISAATKSDSINIGRYESMMHDIGQNIQVNLESTQIVFQIVPFLIFSNFSKFFRNFEKFYAL